MQNFEKREDGTWTPSAELLRKVQSNPEQYPDAAQDFSRLSGTPVEEWERKLDPTKYDDGDALMDIQTGLGKGTATVLENLVQTGQDALNYLTDSKEMDDGDEFEGSLTQHYPDAQDETFETIGNVAGQTTTSVGLGALPGGALTKAPAVLKWFTIAFSEAAVGAAADTNEATLVDAADQLGVLPEDLAEATEDLKADPEDPAVLTRLKNLGIDMSILGMLAVGGAGAGRLIGGSAKKADEVVEVVEEVAALDAAEKVAETVTKRVTNDTPSTEAAVEQATQQTARQRVDEAVSPDGVTDPEVIAGSVPYNPLDPKTRAIVEEALAPADTLVARVVDKSEQTRLANIWDVKGGKQKAAELFLGIQRALDAGDIEKVVKLASKDLLKSASELEALRKGATIRATLSQAQAKFDEVIKDIRANPKLKTDEAYLAAYGNTLDGITELHRLYRTLGRSSSYQQLLRKDGVLKEMLEERKMMEELEDGLAEIYPGMPKQDFVSIKSRELFQYGLDPVAISEEVGRQWSNLAGAGVPVKYKRAVEATFWSQLVRLIKDIQGTMLLSQFSTVSVNALSTALNTAVAPIYNVLGRGDITRGVREYAGYAHASNLALKRAWETVKRQEGVLDNFDRLENASGITDKRLAWASTKSADKQGFIKKALTRLITFVTDLQLGTDEFFKQVRYQGVRYADGIHIAKQKGLSKAEQKKFALQYVQDGLEPNGKAKDPVALLEATRTAFQDQFDSQYVTGRFLGSLDQLRRREDAYGLMANIIVPFLRTPINLFNIALNAGGVSLAGATVKAGARAFGYRGKFPLKVIDDFAGSNGPYRAAAARSQAVLGGLVAGTLYYLETSGMMFVTGPTSVTDWRTQRGERNILPPNSIVIGEKAFDLNRWLPFSAPLIYYGAVTDGLRRSDYQKTGSYLGDTSGSDDAVAGMGGYGLAIMSMLRDTASLQGISNLLQGLADATTGDLNRLGKLGASVPTQFVPGHWKMFAKFQNPDAIEGYDFMSRISAQLGFAEDSFRKLDAFGQQVKYSEYRGLFPDGQPIDRMAQSHYQELWEVMKKTGKSLELTWPTQLFSRRFSDAGFTEKPSAHVLKTKDGQNAWEYYRDRVYTDGMAKATKAAPSGQSKDGLEDFIINKGETFEQAISRLIDSPMYVGQTYDQRHALMNAVKSKFHKQALAKTEAVTLVPKDLAAKNAFGRINGELTVAKLKDLKKANSRFKIRDLSEQSTYQDKFQSLNSIEQAVKDFKAN